MLTILSLLWTYKHIQRIVVILWALWASLCVCWIKHKLWALCERGVHTSAFNTEKWLDIQSIQIIRKSEINYVGWISGNWTWDPTNTSRLLSAEQYTSFHILLMINKTINAETHHKQYSTHAQCICKKYSALKGLIQ